MCEPQSLTPELIKLGLGGIGQTADGSSMVYLSCNLDNLSLIDITALSSYRNLQHVSACSNLLTDAECLSELQSLRSFSASRNRIRDADKAIPHVFALQNIDLSHNVIQVMPTSLAHHRYLRVLHLDNNQILEINGLSGMKSLVELSLNDNCLRSVSGLEGTGLRRLFLAGNEISDVRGVEAVAGTLMHLVASSNEIASLRSIDQLEKLVELDLGGNGIAQTAELQRLRALSHLRVLHIQENPVFDSPASAANDDSCACSDIVCGDSEDPDSAPHTPTPPPTNPLGDSVTADPSLLEETLLSRYSTLFAVPQLTHLNGVEVTRKEKVKAVNILGNADIESRAKNEMQFLKTTVTTVGGP